MLHKYIIDSFLVTSGERPYLCQVPGCNKRFTEYSSLYKHHVVHTHNKPYTCDICSKTYRQTSTLANHKRTAHGELTVVENMSVESKSRCLHWGGGGEGGNPKKKKKAVETGAS